APPVAPPLVETVVISNGNSTGPVVPDGGVGNVGAIRSTPFNLLLTRMSNVIRRLPGLGLLSGPAPKLFATTLISTTSAPSNEAWASVTWPGFTSRRGRSVPSGAMSALMLPPVGAMTLTVFFCGLTSNCHAAPRYCAGMGGLPGRTGAEGDFELSLQ